MSEKDIPMVPKFQAERDKVHQTKMNRYMLWAIAIIVTGFTIFAICMVIQANIFVSGYSSKTKDWLNTIRQLQGTSAATEVVYEYQADP